MLWIGVILDRGNAGGFWGMSKDGTELVEKNFREQIGFYDLWTIFVIIAIIHDVRDNRNDPAARLTLVIILTDNGV